MRYFKIAETPPRRLINVTGLTWRRRWITAVILLRSVGYVLNNVDAQRSASYKLAIESAWKALNETKPDPAIFWAFIDRVRHSIVKEYKLGAGQNVTVHVPVTAIDLKTGTQTSSVGTPTEYHGVLNDGPYKGKSQSEVLLEALNLVGVLS